MSENESETESVEDGKEVAFYTESVNAWFTTRLERDKSLLTLSGAAVGLLVTLLTTVGIKSSIAFFLYGAALFSFIVCIFMVLLVFSRNSHHIEKVISGEEEKDNILSSLDYITPTSFILGVILFSVIGLSIGLDSLINHKFKIADKTINTTQTNKPDKKQVSINGIDKDLSKDNALLKNENKGDQHGRAEKAK